MPIYREGLGDITGRLITIEHGWLEYRYAPGYTVELLHIEVDKGYRNNGVGTGLVSILEGISKKDGLILLFAFMQEGNTGAWGFYKKLGFTKTYIPNFYGIENNAFIVIKMLETN